MPSIVAQAAIELDKRNRTQSGPNVWLWLPSSWGIAQQWGMSAQEYASWVSVGLWNLDGAPGVARMVKAYRDIIRDRAWLLPAAGYTPEDAAAQAHDGGPEALLDAAETIIALRGMADMLPESERWNPVAETEMGQQDGPISFR